MNWHLSHLCSAVLFCVGIFCLLCFGGFVLVGAWFLFVVTSSRPSGLLQFTFDGLSSADGHVYALINSCSLI